MEKGGGGLGEESLKNGDICLWGASLFLLVAFSIFKRQHRFFFYSSARWVAWRR